jgi:hypothetical protein
LINAAITAINGTMASNPSAEKMMSIIRFIVTANRGAEVLREVAIGKKLGVSKVNSLLKFVDRSFLRGRVALTSPIGGRKRVENASSTGFPDS